jgi:hypothetical protein
MPAAQAESSLMEAITQGKVDLYLRYRYEFISDAKSTALIPKLEDADAQTVRTALGYDAGLFHGLGAYLQFEDVHALGEHYNDGGTNGKTRFATVVDPEGTELQQANLRYQGIADTVFRLGRQEIEHRQAPLQRYVSNLAARQNWQSFDAFRATHDALVDRSTGVPRLKLDYAYVWNVNRTFGEDNPLPDLADFRMASHLLRVEYDGIKLAKLEAYNYYLDFDSDVAATLALSTNTIGMRAEGNYSVDNKWKLLYAAEYAHQHDIADNPVDVDVNYYLAEGGAAYQIGQNWLDTVTLKLSYEVLEGDGDHAFQTPIATAHPFQGWADRIVTTPPDGVDDFFVTLRASGILGATFVLMYHTFDANNLDYNYGTEWDALLERPFGKNLLGGIKYAAYDASSDSLNVARNSKPQSASGQAFDLDKFWVYVQFKY